MSNHQPKFTPVICIGLGFSGLCLGAQLKRKYGLNYTDVHFYDKNTGYSGTWHVNRYPGESFFAAFHRVISANANCKQQAQHGAF